VCPVELSRDRLREAVLERCREQRIEPPGRIDRIVGAAVTTFEQRFCAEILARLSPETSQRLQELIAGDADGVVRVGGGRGLLSELSADPGRLGLETLLGEIAKLERVRALGLPGDLQLFGEARCVLARESRDAVPVRSAGCESCGAVDIAGGAVLGADGGDHRLARGSADRAEPQDDQRAVGESR